MVQVIAAFMEFCYLAQQSQLNENMLDQIDRAVAHFHCKHKIFKETGVCDDFSLPRQHSITHYRFLIQQFGAPNGFVCQSQSPNTELLSKAPTVAQAAMNHLGRCF
jgi:hypothetical protein